MNIEELFYMLEGNKPYVLAHDDPFTVDNWTRLCVSLKYLTQIATYIYLPPVNFIYVQIYDQPSPQDLWPSARWQAISAECYEGSFFRAEGGNAQSFYNQSIPQEDQLKRHTHKYWRVSDGGNRGDRDGKPRFADNGLDHDTLETGGSETRPINYTVRIWERVE
jgi:hypothetical protein